MAEVTLIEAIRQAMDEEMARDERVVLMGEDVGRRGGVFLATQGLYEKYGEARVVDMPLAEVGIAGIAIGAALYGLRPIAEMQFADFMHPAFDQIVNEAAKMRYRSNGAWTCPLVIRAPCGGGVGGGLYHSQCVESFYTHVPGLKVIMPATPHDAKGLLKAAVRDPDPVLFFEHKRAYRLIKGDVPDEDYVVPIGVADIKRAGTDITLVSYGMTLHLSLQAAEEVAQEGISVEVVDMRTLLPLDKRTLLDSVRKTGKVLIVHEDTLTCGYGAELGTIIAEEAFEYLDAPVRRLTAPDAPSVAFNAGMRDYYLPNAAKIAQAIRALAAY
jgi:2-oxoisovalerate dehydrogenase E1 component beta subunit